MRTSLTRISVIFFTLTFMFLGCLDDGEPADSEVDAGAGKDTETSKNNADCGQNGSAHGDHCHCFMGYMFDGETCVVPAEITTECNDSHQSDMACVCPDTGMCPCDGDTEDHDGKTYCVPHLEA